MRTTIEITEAQRGELLRLAATRGEKGFSSIVREAVDLYLKQHRSRAAAVRLAVGARGALSDAEAEGLRDEVAQIRKRWR